jgi:hypothetical protein
MKNKWAFVILSVVFLVISCPVPSISLAEDAGRADLEVEINRLEKANALSVIPQKGTCDLLSFQVKANHVFKAANMPRTYLRIVIPYEIYWYPDAGQDFANGQKVDQGILDVKKDTQLFHVKYDPKNNPNGARGEYVLKVKLKVNGHVIDQNLSTKLVINENCPANVPAGVQKPGTPVQPGHHEPPSSVNDRKESGKGGLLPVTSADYGNKIVSGFIWVFLGLVIHLLSVLNKKNSWPG